MAAAPNSRPLLFLVSEKTSRRDKRPPRNHNAYTPIVTVGTRQAADVLLTGFTRTRTATFVLARGLREEIAIIRGIQLETVQIHRPQRACMSYAGSPPSLSPRRMTPIPYC